MCVAIHRLVSEDGYVQRPRAGLTRFAAPGSVRCLSTGAGTGHAPFRRVTEPAAQAAARHGLLHGTCVPPLDHVEREGMAMTIVDSRARSRVESTPTSITMSRPRWTRTAVVLGCGVVPDDTGGVSSRCTNGCAGSVPVDAGRGGGHRRLRRGPGAVISQSWGSW